MRKVIDYKGELGFDDGQMYSCTHGQTMLVVKSLLQLKKCFFKNKSLLKLLSILGLVVSVDLPYELSLVYGYCFFTLTLV